MRKPRAVLGVLQALKPVDAAGFGCALAYGVLSRSARQSGEPPLILFLAVAVWAALLTFGLYAYHRRNPGAALGPGRLIGWAILFRICGGGDWSPLMPPCPQNVRRMYIWGS